VENDRRPFEARQHKRHSRTGGHGGPDPRPCYSERESTLPVRRQLSLAVVTNEVEVERWHPDHGEGQSEARRRDLVPWIARIKARFVITSPIRRDPVCNRMSPPYTVESRLVGQIANLGRGEVPCYGAARVDSPALLQPVAGSDIGDKVIRNCFCGERPNSPTPPPLLPKSILLRSLPLFVLARR
jgi:hypothetical protein